MPRAGTRRDAKRVFISYALDAQRYADLLRHALIEAGFDVTWDGDSPIGGRWAASLAKSFEETDIFVVLLSKAAATTPLMMLEIGEMIRRREYSAASPPRIVPVLIDAGSQNLGLLNQYQALDAIGETPERAARQIVDTLVKVADQEAGVPLDERKRELEFLSQSALALNALQASDYGSLRSARSRIGRKAFLLAILVIITSLVALLIGVYARIPVGGSQHMVALLAGVLSATIAVCGAAVAFYIGRRERGGKR